MKKLSIILPIVLLLAVKISAHTLSDNGREATQLGSNGICFTENKGQIHDLNYKARPDVLFGAMAGPMAFHLRNSGVSYQLFRTETWKETIDPKTRETQKEIDEQTIYRIDLNWVRANANYKVITDDVLPGYNNYYLENCPKGALYVKSYTGVTLQNLYPGINLHYYEKEGQLKHDYIVKPGADYKQIQLKIEGATIETSADGSLILSTPLGKIEEGSPVVFQRGKVLTSRWVIENCTLSFEIEKYDPAYELVIDPVTRVWGTHYGGTSDEYGNGCSTDAAGNVYLSGKCGSNAGNEIATSGIHQQTYGGFTDAFLAKFNPNGLRLWGTYYGGSGAESSSACAADIFGNVYMVGTTSSSGGNAIATPGAHQQVFYGSSVDAFLVKFNGNGIRQWGTYYGSYGWDLAKACATDAFGNVYMAGDTDSGALITTAGSHQQSYGGSYGDAFLVKFDSVGVRQWGTYYGGNDDETGTACATDAQGNVYLTGSTYNIPGTVIATTGSHQQNFGGGSLDAYLVKFNSAGVRQWGTYYGGNLYDYGYSCTTDAAGNVFISGNSNSFASSTAIATPGSHQTSANGGSIDAFLVKFNSAGIRQWGTFYGSFGSDDGFSCATDALGNVYLGGRTNSGGGMSGSSVFQPNYGGGTYDAYLTKFNANGSSLWGTYYGSNSTDYGRYCAADDFGNVFLVGETTSSTGTAIASTGSHQESSGGLLDAFLVKITDCVRLKPTASVDSIVCMGDDINFNVSLTGSGSYTYTWVGPDNYSSTLQNPVISNASALQVGIYTVTVMNGACGEMSSAEVKVVDECAGISKIGANDDLLVYPNPSSNTLNIELQARASYHFKDLLGREITQGELSEGKNSLDLGQLEKGCYLLLITDGQYSKTVKVIKE